MSPSRAIRRVSSVVGSAVVLLALALVNPLGAQTLNNAFGGLSENSSDPIDIEADVLTVYDAKKKATFKGNVKAVQGTTTLRAAELDVYYIGGTERLTGQQSEAVPVANKTSAPGAKDDGDGPEAQISKIEARGSVVITTGDDQTTTSDWALYDVPSQIVTVGGNVVLSQGQNVLKGDRLVIDLKTGESRFENSGISGTGGRVRALFMPKQGGGVAEPAGAKKPASSTAASDGESVPAAVAPAQSKRTPAGGGADSAEPLPIMPEFR